MCSANDNEKPPRAWPMALLRLLPLPAFPSPSCPFQSGPGGCTRRRRRRFASRFSQFRNGLFKAIFPGRPVELPLKSKSKSYNHFKHSQTAWGGGGEWRVMPDNIIRHMQTERTTKVALMMSCLPPLRCRCPLGWH